MGEPPAQRAGCLSESIGKARQTRGTETSQYPEEEKANAISRVVASETETAQTRGLAPWGCRTLHVEDKRTLQANGLEGPAKEGKRPVAEEAGTPEWILSTAGHEKPRRKPGGPSPKAKYFPVTDSEPVP